MCVCADSLDVVLVDKVLSLWAVLTVLMLTGEGYAVNMSILFDRCHEGGNGVIKSVVDAEVCACANAAPVQICVPGEAAPTTHQQHGHAEATTYCAWKGKTLPTELTQAWRAADRIDLSLGRYPVGSGLTCRYADEGGVKAARGTTCWV